MVVAVYRDLDRLPLRHPAHTVACDDAADARDGHTGVTRERIDPVGGLGRGGEAQLVIITATEGAGGLHGGGLRGERGADRQGSEFDFGTDAAGLQDVAQITGQSVGQVDGAVYLIGRERRQGTSERHARRGLFETCAQRGQVGGIDGDLAALKASAARTDGSHRRLPRVDWPAGMRMAVNFTADFDAMLLRRLFNEPPSQLAKGEFGATIMFVSNIPGETQTLALAIFSLIETPGAEAAVLRLVWLSIAVSFVALLASEYLAQRVSRSRA